MKNHSQITKYDVYHWRGINRHGETLSGKYVTINIKTLKDELRQQDILVQHVWKKPRWFLQINVVRDRDILLFSKQLATLLSAGIPILHAFDLLIRDTKNYAFQNLLISIKSELEQGNSLASTLQKHPKYFNTIYCQLINVGEKSGSLDIILERIVVWKEKSAQMKNKIKKALAYPLIVFSAALFITILILVFVVPQFVNLFNTFGAALPLSTQWVIQLTHIFQNYGWIIFLFFLFSSMGLFWFRRKFLCVKRYFDGFVLRLPISGKILQQACIARLMRALSTLVAAGIPLSDALHIASETGGNYYYTKAMLQIRQFINNGQSLQFAFKQTQKFPDVVTQLIGIGETTGRLEQILIKLADMFEKESEQAIDMLNHLLEPFIMLILGTIIGGLVITMYLPIFKLSNIV